jgi:hypothetical protein
MKMAISVRILAGKHTFIFKLLKGETSLRIGEEKEKYFSAFPAMRAFPITMQIKLAEGQFKSRVRYQIILENTH